MNKVTMALDGMDAVKRGIRESPEFVRLKAAESVARTTFAVAQRARAAAKRDTGALRAAIQAKSRGLSGRFEIAAGEFFGRRPDTYWFFVEYGTEKMPASPFVRPSADAEANNYVADIRRIGTALERAFTSGRFT
jgi:HK97 gp10 family phage protein